MLLDVASLSTCFYHSKLHGQVDEYRADSNKERKLRERAEQYSRELEQEIEAAKRKNLNRGPTASHLEMSQEISRFGQNLNSLRCRNVLKNLKIIQMVFNNHRQLLWEISRYMCIHVQFYLSYLKIVVSQTCRYSIQSFLKAVFNISTKFIFNSG